jgi:uncharacterized protein (TIGR02246 family)
MSEKKIESIIRGFVEAVAKRDADKTLSFLAEDAVWVAPEGTFKGKKEIKRLLTWMAQSARDTKFRDTGIGIMVKGNKAVYEYVIEAVTSEGMKYETPGVCVYEFSGEKIEQHRALYDRLSVAKQVGKGPFAKRVINYMIKRWEKGLH